MRNVPIFLLASCGIAAAAISYRSEELHKRVRRADIVVHVRLEEIITRFYTEGARAIPCGNDYVVKVLQTYKGKTAPTVSFSSSDALSLHGAFNDNLLGDEFLLLLNEASHAPTLAGPPDVIRMASAEEKHCLASLQPRRFGDAIDAAFYIDRSAQPARQILIPSTTLLPKAVRTFAHPQCRAEQDGEDACVWADWLQLEKLLAAWGAQVGWTAQSATPDKAGLTAAVVELAAGLRACDLSRLIDFVAPDDRATVSAFDIDEFNKDCVRHRTEVEPLIALLDLAKGMTPRFQSNGTVAVFEMRQPWAATDSDLIFMRDAHGWYMPALRRQDDP